MSKRASLLVHFREIRRRILWSFFYFFIFFSLSFIFFDNFVYFFSTLFDQVTEQVSGRNLYITSVTEGFRMRLHLAFLIAFVAGLPIFLYHALSFIIPGLKKKERFLVIIVLFFSLILSFFGFYLAYFKIIPYSIEFLLSKPFIPDGVGLVLHYHSSLYFVLHTLFYVVILFQFPIIIELLLYLDVVTRRTLLCSGRYVVVIIFSVSAIVTPPDVVTQVGLALPLIVLYFLTIFFARLFGWGNNV